MGGMYCKLTGSRQLSSAQACLCVVVAPVEWLLEAVYISAFFTLLLYLGYGWGWVPKFSDAPLLKPHRHTNCFHMPQLTQRPEWV